MTLLNIINVRVPLLCQHTCYFRKERKWAAMQRCQYVVVSICQYVYMSVYVSICHYVAHGCLFWNMYAQSQKKRPTCTWILSRIGMSYGYNNFVYHLDICFTNYNVFNSSAHVIPVSWQSPYLRLQTKKNFSSTENLSLFLTFRVILE
jgi:hypothetical protein